MVLFTRSGTMMELTFVTKLILYITIAGVVRPDCPDGWIQFRGSCYHFGHESLTFQEAEAFCVHHHSHLIDIGSAFENYFIKSYLAELKEPKHWLGLKDDVIEGLWAWYDTDKYTNFTNWAPGEPNGHEGENCAAIWGDVGYNWLDVPCSMKYKAMCEMKSVRPACSEIVG